MDVIHDRNRIPWRSIAAKEVPYMYVVCEHTCTLYRIAGYFRGFLFLDVSKRLFSSKINSQVLTFFKNRFPQVKIM